MNDVLGGIKKYFFLLDYDMMDKSFANNTQALYMTIYL